MTTRLADVSTPADEAGVSLGGDPARGLLDGVTPTGGETEPAALVPGDLPLERAFRLLLAHPDIRWLVTPDGGLVSRAQLVPAALERLAQGSRAALHGDPVAPGSGLRYRCPADPDEHVFTSADIEVWTTDLRAKCPRDGRVLTAFLPVSEEE
ncbi:hypothetical protein [Lentzea sp. NPDC004782]|uniref:hypothetical protein n=1 Tax=Lentzea sp. NPDC004782 TaxID=3154458 RepID=UPI0033BB2DF4